MSAPVANQTGFSVKHWRWFAFAAWLLFLTTFPAAIVAAWVLARGQDAAGHGIGIALGLLAGLLGGVGAAVLVSYATARLFPSVLGKLLACLPWMILAAFWGNMFFAPSGAGWYGWLEKLVPH